jgi:Domain of unknown function (DUF4389)
MSGGRIALLVTGSILALVSLGLLAGGAVLLWAHTTQRNDDGYYATRYEPLASDGYAIRSDDLDLGTEGPDWLFEEGRLGTIRLTGRSLNPAKGLFLGIGPEDEVEQYLASVEHDVLVDVELDPFRPEYRDEPGIRRPAPPQAQTFWAAARDHRVTWEVEEGDWVAVVLNADGSRGVVAEISAAAKTDLLLWGGLIVLGLGMMFGGGAALLIVLALRGAHPLVEETAPEAAAPVAEGEYPVQVEGELEPGLSRWLWLVKWLLLIPHIVILAFLWAALVVVTIVAFFAILFTERYPRSLFGFSLGVLRWTWRVSWYGYGGLATDRYPPFTLQDVADYPARLQVPYPERLSRGLVLVKWWLLAIPHYLVVGVFLGGGWWFADWFPGLIGLLVFFAAVVLLVRGRYPRDLYDLILGTDRWVVRVATYALLMRDEYPPFRLSR